MAYNVYGKPEDWEQGHVDTLPVFAEGFEDEDCEYVDTTPAPVVIDRISGMNLHTVAQTQKILDNSLIMKNKRNRNKPVRDSFGRMPSRYCMGPAMTGNNHPGVYAGYRDFRRGHFQSTF